MSAGKYFQDFWKKMQGREGKPKPMSNSAKSGQIEPSPAKEKQKN
jgi:hypothetical protein